MKKNCDRKSTRSQTKNTQNDVNTSTLDNSELESEVCSSQNNNSALNCSGPCGSQVRATLFFFQSFLLGLLGSGEPSPTINDLIGPLSLSKALNCKSRSRSHLTNLADPQTLLRKCLNPNDMNAKKILPHCSRDVDPVLANKNRVRDSVP